jgi:hypothetical protein
MRTITRYAAAVLFAAGFGTPALAQDWVGPRVVGTGENGSVEYPTPSQNIVGGATYRVTGSGEGASIEVVAIEHTMPGRLSHTVGSGESQYIVYIDQPEATRVARGGMQR